MFGQNVRRTLALNFPPWQWFSLELVLQPIKFGNNSPAKFVRTVRSYCFLMKVDINQLSSIGAAQTCEQKDFAGLRAFV